MHYKLVKQLKDDNTLRKSFIDLAIKTFDLSFDAWYQQGYWSESYIPYAFVDKNKVIANASANIIDLVWQGQPRRYIQIGTVMTNIDYRNKGLAGQLIQHILDDWRDKADAFSCSPTLLPSTSIPNLALRGPTNINMWHPFRLLPATSVNWIWIVRRISPCLSTTTRNPTPFHSYEWKITSAC